MNYAKYRRNLAKARGGVAVKNNQQQELSGLPAETFTEFKDGTYLCTTPSAERYKNVAVVRDANGEANCPADTKPCSLASVTVCVSPDKHNIECPITDIKLVEASSFDINQHQGYTEVAAPTQTTLSWKLLYSRTAKYLPLARFELTEEQPCLMSGAFKIDRDTSSENLADRTEDVYVNQCPQGPIETSLEDTTRVASNAVTVNERDWMQSTGIIDKIDSLEDTDWEAWATKKAQNEFKLWQRSMAPWTSACDSNQNFKDSVDRIDQALSEGNFGTYKDVNDLKGTVVIIWVVKFVVLFLAIIIFVIKSKKGPVKKLLCSFVTFTITSVAVELMALIAEVMLFSKVSLSDYYGTDIYAFLEVFATYKGCSSVPFDKAIEEFQ